ncbi:MAG TPA: type II secretion system F family protein [Coriobacteriia bacterium]|nr:type II secretion system F family protein [Coriobacteriia bacterium]
MAQYTYNALTNDGKTVKGLVEAFDEVDAMEKARSQAYLVQDVKKVREAKGLLSADIGKPRLKTKDLAILCSQFSIILKAGLSAVKAVGLVGDQTNNNHLKRVLNETSTDVQSGHSLADSLESKGKYLPRVFTETIRAGEESGNLASSYERLHSYFDNRSKIAGKVAGALTYPIFVLVIAIVVVAVMMVFVIPAIGGMVSSLGSEMPAITQFLIDSSNFVSANILWIILVMLAVFLAFYLYGRQEIGRDSYAKIAMRLPVLGKVNVYSGAAQFANTMSTLIAAGLSTSRAIQITARVMSNYVLSKEVGRMEAELQSGRSLGECMATSKYLPKTLIEMTAVGEQAGELEETLAIIGEFYDSETERVTNRALSLMEPALLVLMAVFAGFIVVALYLPMFTMYSGMQG